MKFIELVAQTYCKEEADYTREWLDAAVHNKQFNRKDRSKPIWRWALKRWGVDVWPRAEYFARTARMRAMWPHP